MPGSGDSISNTHNTRRQSDIICQKEALPFTIGEKEKNTRKPPYQEKEAEEAISQGRVSQAEIMRARDPSKSVNIAQPTPGKDAHHKELKDLQEKFAK